MSSNEITNFKIARSKHTSQLTDTPDRLVYSRNAHIRIGQFLLVLDGHTGTHSHCVKSKITQHKTLTYLSPKEQEPKCDRITD